LNHNTVDLKAAGRAIGVTNENKISYIGLMADYYMNARIRAQSRAFVAGFKALIPDR
jgi:ubiquitin-protein ligase E3 B